MAAKSVISREVAVAAGAFAPGHLGELTRIVPFEMVDEVLADTGRTQQRIRDLPSRVVVYLLLGGALFPGLGWQQVWQRLTAGLDGLPTATPRPARWPRPARGSGPDRCVTCSTCFVDRPRDSGSPERGGTDCSSAPSTAR
ncbi:transposase domain-containing protein [Streptomyces zhihengii]